MRDWRCSCHSQWLWCRETPWSSNLRSEFSPRPLTGSDLADSASTGWNICSWSCGLTLYSSWTRDLWERSQAIRKQRGSTKSVWNHWDDWILPLLSGRLHDHFMVFHVKHEQIENAVYLKRKNSLVPGRMSDISIKGPEFWIRAWWCKDTPVQKFCGFTDWLNSVSVTGTAALSSPVPGNRKTNAKNKHHQLSHIRYCKNDTNEWCMCCWVQPHAYLFDALLVLNEQLNTGDVDVEPRPLRRALHWSVYTAIVLAAHT